MFKRKLGSNLFVKYFLMVFVSIALSLVILGGMLLVLVQNYWSDEKTELLHKNVDDVANLAAVSFREADSDREVRNMLCNNLNSISRALEAEILICDTKGNIIFCGCGGFIGEGIPHTGDKKNYYLHHMYDIPEKLLSEASKGDYTEKTDFSGSIQRSNVVARPLVYNHNGEKFTYIIIAVQVVSQTVTPIILAFFRMFGFATLMSLSVAFMVGWFMTYKMTKPLRQMSAATKAYAVGDFSPRVTVKGEGEMAELAAAFNSMAKSILESSRRSFVANVSHELKTPMTTIGGFIDGILDGTIDESKRDYYLNIVSDEIKRLSRLVTGMLNMSKIEAGELKLKPKVFDLSQMIITTLLGFEHLIENKNINIVGLENFESLNVKADGDLINQVVYNLIDNAVKFTPKDGYIKITAAKTDKETVVAVRNSGNGIPRDERERVFERFYKIDKSRSYDTKGAGLGLYIVKTIVDMHGGKISVDSAEGEYTEFCFRLPNVD